MFGRKKLEAKPNTAKTAELSAALWHKGLALIVSFSLLVTLIVAGTVAWYTRITNVTGITMDVAKFDFTADYVKEDFIVDVTHYMNVTNKKAAPGTGGMIPIRVSAQGSEVDVDYSLNLDVAKMAPEFRQRLRFFYYIKDENGNVQEVTIQDGSPEIKGSLQMGTWCYEYVYWEWVYTLSKEMYYEGNSWKSNSWKTFTPEQVRAFDQFDTELGLGTYDLEFTDRNGKKWEADAGTGNTPVVDGSTSAEPVDLPLLAYQKAMEAKLNISGAQARPVEGVASEPSEGQVAGMTVMKDGTDGLPTGNTGT